MQRTLYAILVVAAFGSGYVIGQHRVALQAVQAQSGPDPYWGQNHRATLDKLRRGDDNLEIVYEPRVFHIQGVVAGKPVDTYRRTHAEAVSVLDYLIVDSVPSP
jgi:hypothetical protein